MYNELNEKHIPKRSTTGSAGYDIPVSELPKVMYFTGPLEYINHCPAVMNSNIASTYERPYGQSDLTHTTLCPNVVYRFHTGIHLDHGDITNRQHIMIVPRSSMRKCGLRMLNTVGIIDSDYRDEIQIDVCVERPFDVYIGDRLCQMLVCENGRIAGEIEPTETRSGGFGSTGV